MLYGHRHDGLLMLATQRKERERVRPLSANAPRNLLIEFQSNCLCIFELIKVK